ncbi:MAG: glycosyltransferase, partial [Kiritimatiellia bacterium]
SVARWIEEHDCGWVIAPDNQQAVYYVAEVLADRDELQAKGEHAAALSRTLFDAAENRQKIIALLEQMANT